MMGYVLGVCIIPGYLLGLYMILGYSLGLHIILGYIYIYILGLYSATSIQLQLGALAMHGAHKRSKRLVAGML